MRVKFLLAELFRPRKLKIGRDVAEYVQELFLSGASPADIGRAVDKRFGRTRYAYFKIPNADRSGFEFAPADYEIDGLEYIRAAMDKVGAIKRGYYVNAHPMVQRIAQAAASAPLPQGRS